MKFKQVKDYKLEALRIKKRNDLEEDTSGMLKFHMVFTVDGTKSEQTVSAVNIQKAEELIKKQYDGKNVTFTSKQQVKESYSALDYFDAVHTIGKLNPGDKFKNRNGVEIKIIEPDKLGRVQFKIGNDVRSGSERSIQNMLYKNNYLRSNGCDEDYDESLKEDLKQETPQTSNDTGLANMLIHAINGEWETISEYNDILTVIRNNNQLDMIPVVEDILSEENKHVGQLQKILETISGNVADISEGEQEASKQMSDETVDDDFGPNSGFDIYLV